MISLPLARWLEAREAVNISLVPENMEEELKSLIQQIYLTGYDQGSHESGDDETLEAFNLFWSQGSAKQLRL